MGNVKDNANLTVTNVHVYNYQVNSKSSAGGLIGKANGGATVIITDCDMNGPSNIVASDQYNNTYVGGLLGEGGDGDTITITNSNVNTTGALGLSAYGGAGGLVGKTGNSAASINNSSVKTGSLTLTSGYGYTGGLISMAEGTVTINNSSVETGDLIFNGDKESGGWIGGVGGSSSVNITDTALLANNMKISASNGTAGGMIGGLVQNAGGSSLNVNRSNVTAVGAIDITSGSNVGGMIGNAGPNAGTVTVNSSHVNAETIVLSGTNGSAGGIIGRIDNGSATVTMTDSVSAANSTFVITGGEDAGGLIGRIGTGNKVSVSKTAVTGDTVSITSNTKNAGGGIGLLDRNAELTIDKVKIQGTQSLSVNGKSSAGGFLGYADGGTKLSISDTYILSDYTEVDSSKESMGGPAGGFIGGVNKSEALSINNCFTSAFVYEKGQYNQSSTAAGGFIGMLNVDGTSNTISNCYVGGHTVGGKYGTALSGENRYNVISNYYSGGFIGYSEGTITVSNSFTTASAYSERNANGQSNCGVGGFVGTGKGMTIKDCYSAGLVNAAKNTNQLIGGFIGDGLGNSYTNNFYVDGISGSLKGVGNNSGSSDIEGVAPAAYGPERPLWKDTNTAAEYTNAFDSSKKGSSYPLKIWTVFHSNFAEDAKYNGSKVFYGDWQIPDNADLPFDSMEITLDTEPIGVSYDEETKTYTTYVSLKSELSAYGITDNTRIRSIDIPSDGWKVTEDGETSDGISITESVASFDRA